MQWICFYLFHFLLMSLLYNKRANLKLEHIDVVVVRTKTVAIDFTYKVALCFILYFAIHLVIFYISYCFSQFSLKLNFEANIIDFNINDKCFWKIKFQFVWNYELAKLVKSKFLNLKIQERKTIENHKDFTTKNKMTHFSEDFLYCFMITRHRVEDYLPILFIKNRDKEFDHGFTTSSVRLKSQEFVFQRQGRLCCHWKSLYVFVCYLAVNTWIF